MRIYRHPSLLVLALCSISASAALGCRSRIREPEPEPAAQAVAPHKEPQPATPAPAPEPPKPKDGWSEVSRQNNLSVCIFANQSEREQIQSVVGVKKQVLLADRPITVGVFAPYCINPDCDEVTNIKCSVERSGNTLRVQTSYAGFHKTGTQCSDKCQDVRAGCDSPTLEAGQYTLSYGGTVGSPGTELEFAL